MLLWKIKESYRRLISEEWNIGFVDNLNGLFEKENLTIQWMKHSYKRGWFADPFILNITDSYIIVLVEEFQYLNQKGCISKLTIDKYTFELLNVKQILCLDSHLSFPAIFRLGEDVFIYPENCVTGRLTVYRYSQENDSIEPINVWSREPLTDAVLYIKDDIPFLLSTKRPVQNGYELNVYIANEKTLADWNFKYLKTILFHDNTARSAGLPFNYKNKCIRPAQVCNDGYGKGIVLQELIQTDLDFSFKEIKRFYPSSTIWNDGLHTFNYYEGMAVVDGRRIAHPILFQTFYLIRRFLYYFLSKRKTLICL